MLEIQDLCVGYYKDLDILQGVSLHTEEAKITAVLDPNGVGKSTLLKTIYGFLKPRRGKVLFQRQDIVGMPTHERVKLGISYIPQRQSVFPHMKVEENLELGTWTFRGDKARIREKIEENYERVSILRDRGKSPAGELSGGCSAWSRSAAP